MDKLYQVRGCSMVPTLADGDVIEIVSDQWQNGDIVVARVGSKNVVKRVAGNRLVGDNTKVSAIFNLHDAIILGKIRKRSHYSANDHLLQVAEADYPWEYVDSFDTRFENIGNSNRTQLYYDPLTNLVYHTSGTPTNIIASYITDLSRYNYKIVLLGTSSSTYNYSRVVGNTTKYVPIGYIEYLGDISLQFWGATDASGNSSNTNYSTWALYQQKLNTPPSLFITTPVTNQSFSTVSGRKTITISGTVSDADNNNVTISAAINGKTKSTVVSNTSTEKTWSLSWDVSTDNIAEGRYSNIVVTADDGMGGIATATMGYTLTVDRTAPVISISGVANGQTYQNSVMPTFSATDSGGSGLATVTATLNGVSCTSGTAVTSAGSKVLIVTATDNAGNQSQQSVNFTVNKVPSIVLFSPATNQNLSEGQVIVVTEDRFTVRITPDDDAGDTLQYKITQGGITKVDWKNCSRGIAFDYTFIDLVLGNNVCQVLVRDDKGGQVTRTFTVRNKASGSTSAALSQKGVREVLIALGYPGTAFSCLNDLKPSGYTGPLSFSGIINFLS